jgi:hypothetical protein
MNEQQQILLNNQKKQSAIIKKDQYLIKSYVTAIKTVANTLPEKLRTNFPTYSLVVEDLPPPFYI